MKFSMILLIIITLMAVGIISLISFDLPETNKEIPEQYSYTTAICDENNYCQDYEVECKNGEVISLSPIEDAAVQFSPSWEDPRNNEIDEELC